MPREDVKEGPLLATSSSEITSSTSSFQGRLGSDAVERSPTRLDIVELYVPRREPSANPSFTESACVCLFFISDGYDKNAFFLLRRFALCDCPGAGQLDFTSLAARFAIVRGNVRAETRVWYGVSSLGTAPGSPKRDFLRRELTKDIAGARFEAFVLDGATDGASIA